MTDDQVLDLVQQARDEAAALALALLEFLCEKKHSTGAVRAMAPYLTADDAKRVVAMGGEIVKKLQADRKAAFEKDTERRTSGLLLPPAALFLPGGSR